MINYLVSPWRFFRLALILTATLLVFASCGGGGGGGGSTGPVASTLSFPLQASGAALVKNGYSIAMKAKGTAATQATDGLCSGTFDLTQTAANTATTFEGSPALSATRVSSIAFTNCTPANVSVTATHFYNSAYDELGFSVVGGRYGVETVIGNTPAMVKVGNSGTLGSTTFYTDSSKAVFDGHDEDSFVVEADTANSVIVNFISKDYNAASQLTTTEQDRVRIDSAGVLTPLSIDIQYSTTSTTHLVFRM
jgi:hypothetical protein